MRSAASSGRRSVQCRLDGVDNGGDRLIDGQSNLFGRNHHGLREPAQQVVSSGISAKSSS